MTRKIWCDLDGVMVDFDEYVRRMLSVKAQKDQKTFWYEMSLKRQPYRRMKPMPYAAELWAAIKDTGEDCGILTAIPWRDSMPTAEADKFWWCAVGHRDDVFGGTVPDFRIGPYSRDKASHCRPGDVIIDDKLENCEQWALAGGIAIHHQGNVGATIRSLRKELAA